MEVNLDFQSPSTIVIRHIDGRVGYIDPIRFARVLLAGAGDQDQSSGDISWIDDLSLGDVAWGTWSKSGKSKINRVMLQYPPCEKLVDWRGDETVIKVPRRLWYVVFTDQTPQTIAISHLFVLTARLDTLTDAVTLYAYPYGNVYYNSDAHVCWGTTGIELRVNPNNVRQTDELFYSSRFNGDLTLVNPTFDDALDLDFDGCREIRRFALTKLVNGVLL